MWYVYNQTAAVEQSTVVDPLIDSFDKRLQDWRRHDVFGEEETHGYLF